MLCLSGFELYSRWVLLFGVLIKKVRVYIRYLFINQIICFYMPKWILTKIYIFSLGAPEAIINPGVINFLCSP